MLGFKELEHLFLPRYDTYKLQALIKMRILALGGLTD